MSSVCTDQSPGHGSGDPPVQSVIRTIHHSSLMLLCSVEPRTLHAELHPSLEHQHSNTISSKKVVMIKYIRISREDNNIKEKKFVFLVNVFYSRRSKSQRFSPANLTQNREIYHCMA